MIFKPLKSVSYSDPVGKRAIKLLKHGISVMSFHKRLDAAPGGLNDIFANLLGLEDVEVLDAGAERVGRIGTLKFPMDCTEFASLIKKTLSAERVLFTRAGGVVKRVAICGVQCLAFLLGIEINKPLVKLLGKGAQLRALRVAIGCIVDIGKACAARLFQRGKLLGIPYKLSAVIGKKNSVF